MLLLAGMPRLPLMGASLCCVTQLYQGGQPGAPPFGTGAGCSDGQFWLQREGQHDAFPRGEGDLNLPVAGDAPLARAEESLQGGSLLKRGV